MKVQHDKRETRFGTATETGGHIKRGTGDSVAEGARETPDARMTFRTTPLRPGSLE